ncbi:hypothetical protein, partial [Burkholderia sp. SIMBA_024]|uniref:hypothetical protein n=1 Tax=Burkholderia sp. SIMBA_024 TaxID=3085768 RepID=UPI003979E985
TRYFKPDDSTWLGQNRGAADRLLRAISSEPEEKNGYATLFRNVSWSSIRQFLANYRVHEDSPDMDRKLMNDYIERQVAD